MKMSGMRHYTSGIDTHLVLYHTILLRSKCEHALIAKRDAIGIALNLVLFMQS